MALTYYQKEYIKCAKDPKYYLNTYGYVFYAKKQKILPMECFKYQEDAIDDFHRFQNNIILKSRQVGVSVITAGYVAWRLIFRNEEKILIVGRISLVNCQPRPFSVCSGFQNASLVAIFHHGRFWLFRPAGV